MRKIILRHYLTARRQGIHREYLTGRRNGDWKREVVKENRSNTLAGLANGEGGNGIL